MVLCYKIITESPQWSGNVSPWKPSSSRLPELAKPMAQLLCSVDHNDSVTSLIDDIPEREWRLLATLARKRDQELERVRLADECRRLWQKEKEERDMVSAEISEQYRRFLDKKRRNDYLIQQVKSYQRDSEDKRRQDMLMNFIRNKEKHSEFLFNWAQGQKASDLIERALEQEAKEILAADRRSKRMFAEEYKKQLELDYRLKKIENAKKKKEAIIKDTTQRVAIANALSHWESTLLRQDVLLREEFRRAQHAAHIELTNQRSARLAYAKERRQNRARKMAILTEQLRDCVRMST